MSLFKNYWLAALWATLLALGQSYLLPPFAGFDEPAHFSSILSYKLDQGHPRHPGSYFHAQVEKAMTLIPGPIHQLKPWKEAGGISYWDFEKLSDNEKAARWQEYKTLDSSRWEEGKVFGNWQAQHPPLYYLFVGKILKIFSSNLLHENFLKARLVSALIFSLSFFILAYFLCHRWQYDSKIIWWASLLPMPYVLGARVTNDALAIPFFTLSLMLLFEQLREPDKRWSWFNSLLLSISLCLTLGAKSYILAMGPVFVLLGFVFLYRDRNKNFSLRFERLSQLALPFAVMLLVWSPWLYSNHLRTGSITGMNELADLRQWGLDTFPVRIQKIQELYTVHLKDTLWVWLGVLVHLLFVSHWFAGTAHPSFYIFQAMLYIVPVYYFFKGRLQVQKIFSLSTLCFGLITAAYIWGWFKFILDMYLYYGKPVWVGGWYYWATMGALIAFYAEIFSQLRTRLVRGLIALQALAFAWTLVTQIQFFSGKWDRHPTYKYPVKILPPSNTH